MLLEYNNLRVPLLAQGEFWEFILKGRRWKVPASMERLYAYLIYCDYDSWRVPDTLRTNDKHITPAEIDAFVEYFKETHPATEEQYSRDSIPLYATEDLPLYIPNPYTTVSITPEQEIELLKKIKSKSRNKKDNISTWFFDYAIKYNIGPKNEDEFFYFIDELCMGFRRQHGLLLDEESRVNKIVKIILAIFFALLPFWMLFYGLDHDYFWLIILGFVGGSCVIGLIREWYYKNDTFAGKRY